MPPTPDLVGRRFGRLQVIAQADKSRRHQQRWECLCDCGSVAYVLTVGLLGNHNKSCGCIPRVPTKEWQLTDLAYLAGIIDGEGTITIFVDKRGRDFRTLCITNCNRDMLAWVETTFGGRVYEVKRVRDYWSRGYQWNVGPLVAENILEACMPYLKIKQEHARIFLEYGQTKHRYGRSMPSAVKELRVSLRDQIRVLNQRTAKAA